MPVMCKWAKRAIFNVTGGFSFEIFWHRVAIREICEIIT